MVYITSVNKTGGRSAVTVLVETQHHRAAARKLHGVSRAGLVVVLIPVQEQNAGGLAFRRCALRCIKLIEQVSNVGLDPAFGDIDAAAAGLDAVGGKHAAENSGEKHRKGDDRLGTVLLHDSLPLSINRGYTTYEKSIAHRDTLCKRQKNKIVSAIKSCAM